jgi:asparagine synthase (glutamine-hydrolysing)
MIMACRPDTTETPICYTFCGQERETLDVRLAARVADACGLEHRILRIGPDFFSDFATHVDKTVYVTDGYLGSLGAHEIYMSRQGRQLAAVRLTGVFGGEILRGVSMFKPFRLSPGLVNPDLGSSPSSFVPGWQLHDQHPVTFAAFSEIPRKRFGTPAASRSQVIFRTPYLDNEIVALAYQIPESVRGSAIPALELIKNADSVLNNIPTDMGPMGESRGLTAALRRFFSKVTFKLDYLHNEGLPHWMSGLDPLLTQLNSGWRVLGHHKFLHYRRWFRRELADYVSAVVQDRQTRGSSLWNPDFLRALAREHILGHKNYVLEIDAVLTLAAVERLLFHNLPREPEQPALSISGTAVAPI